MHLLAAYLVDGPTRLNKSKVVASPESVAQFASAVLQRFSVLHFIPSIMATGKG